MRLFFLVDCKDPSCGNHGWCIEGICICRAGWRGVNCTEIDEKVFTCLPDCSGNGQYNLQTSSCVCNDYWTGPDCSVGKALTSFLPGITGFIPAQFERGFGVPAWVAIQDLLLDFLCSVYKLFQSFFLAGKN